MLKDLVYIVAASVTLVGAFLYLRPRISLEACEPLNPFQPLAAPFVISNMGKWAIVDVDYHAQIVKMEGSNHTTAKNVILRVTHEPITKLRTDNKTTIFLREGISVKKPIIYIEIYIIIKYRMSLLPISFTQHFRFRTERKANGEYVWFQYFSNK